MSSLEDIAADVQRVNLNNDPPGVIYKGRE
jgi:hypothetical protein